jgi:glycogen debranching enzyme
MAEIRVENIAKSLGSTPRRFGSNAERSEIMTRIERMAAAISHLWNDQHNLYLSRDLVAGAPIGVPTSAGFLPLYGGGVPHNRASLMAHTLLGWGHSVRHLVPSTAPTDPRFESRRYWRGPVWAVVNWMIAEGLAEAGETNPAAALRADTASLIAASGFSEYFDALTGVGLGGANFSWTAAIALVLEQAWRLPLPV